MALQDPDHREVKIARARAKVTRYRFGLLGFKWLERILWIGLAAFAVFMTIGIFLISGIGNRVFFGVMAAVCYIAAYLARRFDRYAQDGVNDADRALDSLGRPPRSGARRPDNSAKP